MKICIVAEGSYPYVTGGVSSWIQLLILSMPEHEFIIFAVSAEEKYRGRFKYTLPDNVIGIEECFLETSESVDNDFRIDYYVDDSDINNFISLITSHNTNWDKIFSFLKRYDINNIKNFLLSRDFYSIVELSYKKINSYSPFIDYFWNTKSIIEKLLKVISQKIPSADIYHSVSTGYAGIIASVAKLKHNGVFILTEHGIYTREREEEIIRSNYVKGNLKDLWINYFYCVSACAYKYSDIVTTLFQKNKDFQIHLSCPEEKIRVIPNGVDIKSFQNIPERNYDYKNINIGAVVRMVPIKDIKTMIQSFSIVKEELTKANLYIIGPWDEDEEYYQECKDLIKFLNVKDIIFTGRVDVKEYLGKIDVMLLTSISEGQPLAILEGMACKKPFISTNVGCVRELLEGIYDDMGPCGIVCQVMDYESIGLNTIKILSSPETLKKMGEIAYERVNRYYSLELFKENFKKLYIEAYEKK